MTVDLQWRGVFANAEVNALHAEAFHTRVFSDEEWDWRTIVEAHSLGWVVARDESGALVGFVNVITDGVVHAWIQDVMVAAAAAHQGVGTQLVKASADAARAAGCEYLHVDFGPELTPFYIGACGFTPSPAGLLDLTR